MKKGVAYFVIGVVIGAIAFRALCGISDERCESDGGVLLERFTAMAAGKPYVSDAEVEVFSGVLKSHLSRFSRNEILVKVEVEAREYWYPNENGYSSSYFEEVRKRLPMLRSETWDAFLLVAEEKAIIPDEFGEYASICFISREKFLKILSESGGEGFYESYPCASSVWKFSRVGFDEDGTQALLFIESTGGQSAAWYALLERSWSGRWTVVGTFLVMVS